MGNFDTARLAAALGKTRAARSYDASEIASDAVGMSRAGRRARRALLRQMPINKMAEKVNELASRYDAEFINTGEPDPYLFGLRFHDGTITGMASRLVKIT